MLWYKAWLETRWRMLLPLAMLLFAMKQIQTIPRVNNLPHLIRILPMFAGIWMIAPLMLAASGIDTMSPYRVYKGLQGSTCYTLSMPVSRWKLFASRVIFGIAANAVIIAVISTVAMILYPDIRNLIGPVDGVGYTAMVLLCSIAFYGLTTLYSTFLDQQFQTIVSVASFFALQWIARNIHIASFDLMATLTHQSPQITHRMAWNHAFEWLGMGILLLFASWKVIEAREY